MKKKDNAALADAFRKLSKVAAEIAEVINAGDEKNESTETATADPEVIDKSPIKPAKTETPAKPTTDISFEDVRTVLASKAGDGFRSEVKEILSRHRASCLSDLESRPEEFEEILKEAEALGNG